MTFENCRASLSGKAVTLSGAFSALLGLVVMAAWHFHSPTLLKVFPSFEAMRYNTALGFLLSGAALIASCSGRRRVAVISGLATAALGFITLIEYISGADLLIDQLMVSDTVSALYPGRMASSTALSFVFSGMALVLMNVPASRVRPLILGLSGSIVFSLGATALFGYLSGISAIYTWGDFSSMAVHTALGSVVLGAGIIVAAWREGLQRELGSLSFLPVLVGVSMVTATLLLWRVSAAQESAYVEQALEYKVKAVKDDIEGQMESRTMALLRMAKRWEAQGPPRHDWEADAGLYLSHFEGFHSISFIDSSFSVRWAVYAKKAVGAIFGAEGEAYAALTDAMERKDVAVSRPFILPDGRKAFAIIIPIFKSHGVEGFIAGTFYAKEVLDSILGHELQNGYSVAVTGGGHGLYSSPGVDYLSGGEWGREAVLPLYGAGWLVRVWPGKEVLASLRSPLPGVVLATGIVTSMLLALVVYLAGTAQQRAMAAEEAAASLAREVAERERAEREVEKKALELERSNADLEQFAYVASHDLQEPLRIISGFMQLLSRRYKGRLDGSADEFISQAVEGAGRMQRMIRDILAYSRIGRAGVDFAHVDCEEVFDRTLPCLRASIEEHGAVITRDQLPRVFASDAQLEHLFLNLIGNSIKYRGDQPPRIHVRAELKRDEWLFSFADNGIGIEPKHSERIFGMFERLHAKDEKSGTGIGLAICKKIVENHGGKIWVESEPGAGSTFYFTMPSSRA